jgi:Protein of unknown function (DUF1552)
MNQLRFSRRNLLASLGLGAGFLPLLGSERAIAATPSGFPVRLISITWTNGTVPADFYPAAGPFSAALPSILSPLEPYKSKVLAFRSSSGQKSPIDLQVMIDAGQQYGGHSGYASLLTGFWNKQNNAGGPSIDQLIGDQLVSQGFAAPLLNLGAKNGGYATSWKKAGQMNTPITDPYKVFNSLFSGAPAMAGATGGGGMNSAAAAALKARRASVLDFVSGELQAFSTKLGTEDKAKIQSHLDSVSTLEKKLTDPAGGGTTPPSGGGTAVGADCAQPKLPDGHPSLNDIAHYPDLVGSMMAIAGAAVKCDYARCVTVDLVDDGGGNALTYPWLKIPSPDYHAIAHQGKAGYAQKTQIDNWFYTKVAELVKDLDATPEGNGTVLDNTCILISNDMMEGASHDVHSIPYLIIGGCGGFFKQGQAVSFPKSVPNNQLLTTICHAMGLQVASVGNSAYGGDIDSLLKA